MPPRRTTEDLEDGPDDKRAAESSSKKVRCSVEITRVLETLLQHHIDPVGPESAAVLRPLKLTKPTGAKWGLGHVVAAVLRTVYDFSTTGKEIWRSANASIKLKWREHSGRSSLRPDAQRATALGGLDVAELQHDSATVTPSGSAAQQSAAEAALPEPPRTLQLAKPDAADRLKRGSGWGNTPRSLSRCCVCEQEALDTLVLIVQEHAMCCGAPLQRVDGDGVAYWSSHSMGLVNAFRLVCEAGCSYNWASAKPLPGRPAARDAASSSQTAAAADARTADAGAGVAEVDSDDELCDVGVAWGLRSSMATIPSRPEPPSPGSRPLQCVYTSVYALNILSEIRRT